MTTAAVTAVLGTDMAAWTVAAARGRVPEVSRPGPGGASGQGAAELSLDAGTLTALLRATLPEELVLNVPGWGPLTLALQPPARVQLGAGGVEASIGIRLIGLDLATAILVRYEPRADAATGILSLVPVSAIPEMVLPVEVDLVPLLPAAALPRALNWSLDAPGGRTVQVRCHVQGVEVTAERLVIQLGLMAR